MSKYSIFISCSPRESDATDVGLNQIIKCIQSIRTELNFHNSMIYIIFDGTKNRPLDFTDQHKQIYIQKINYIKTNPPNGVCPICA